MSDFGEILKNRSYNRYEDPMRGIFYHKCILDGDIRKYFIEIYEYDFSRFKENYEGPQYRYDVRMSLHQHSGDYLDIRFGIHNFQYDEDLVDTIESKCEQLFTDNHGVYYEDLAKEPL
jgi:hypothetical protein